MRPTSDPKPEAGSGSPNLERSKLLAASTQQTLAVCLLDDDPSALKATRRLLESVGWEAESFTNPFAFLEHARRHQPRVAVIDIMMPEMNGLEVQKMLRSVSPSTQVVILTSKDDPSVRQQALDGGASAFFLKVLDGEELLAGIENAAAKSN